MPSSCTNLHASLAECIYQKRWTPPATVINNETLHTTAQGGTVAPTKGNVKPPRRTQKSKDADDAKLVFGVVFSLRNMVRRLGGEDDE